MMKYIAKANLDAFFEAADAHLHLYIPTNDKNGKAEYTRWVKGAVLSDQLHTTRSAKDFFFPQTENLVEFKLTGKNIEIIDPRREHEDFAIFGVRACDAKSFDILDSVYLSDPVDTYYKNRRDHGLVISMACTRPEETCFCGTFGIDATAPAGDVVCYPTVSGYFFEAKTEKGSAFLAKIADIFEEKAEDEVNAQAEATKKILEKLPLGNLKADAFGASAEGENKVLQFFNSPKWAELSEACIACGTCTFVCPTCQCYDIKDYDTGHGIKRFRCWDSCMYSDFTKMAHGNPRLTQVERFRQRFMHKLVYYPENNNGVMGCVGCGRCLASCPISMNIVKVMKALEGDK